MSNRANEFLEEWVSDNVFPDAYPQNVADARPLSEQCLQEAIASGISKKQLFLAAGGDLDIFLCEAMERATTLEVDRLSSKDD